MNFFAFEIGRGGRGQRSVNCSFAGDQKSTRPPDVHCSDVVVPYALLAGALPTDVRKGKAVQYEAGRMFRCGAEEH